jgi:hypothetical protein
VKQLGSTGFIPQLDVICAIALSQSKVVTTPDEVDLTEICRLDLCGARRFDLDPAFPIEGQFDGDGDHGVVQGALGGVPPKTSEPPDQLHAIPVPLHSCPQAVEILVELPRTLDELPTFRPRLPCLRYPRLVNLCGRRGAALLGFRKSRGLLGGHGPLRQPGL